MSAKMIWTASDKHSYACPPYKLYWTTLGWSVWNYSRRKACLGRDLTISQAMEVAEKDKNEQICSS